MAPLAGEAFKRALLEQARALGLDAVGVCDAAPFEDERRYLATRTPNPFEHPVIDERVEPQFVLQGAQSIVACAISYHTPDVPQPEGLFGWLSRYCRGLDYHEVLTRRLEALARWIEAQSPGARAVTHVDIGAPLDRAIAARAGLGRLGKSTLLIVPRLGTMTFLGEVFTTVALPPDDAAAWSPCGSCTRCLDACPTGALTPWQLDHEACLGYHNQMVGFIPEQFREALGNRLFGCDTCQDVCPYNRAALSGLHPEFAPLDEPGAWLDLEALLAMTPAEFERQFAPTAAAWRGLETLQRNALVALGNSGDAAALAPLARALSSESPLLRGHAAWALAQLTCENLSAPPVRPLLEARLAIETDADVRRELTRAIARLEEKLCS